MHNAYAVEDEACLQPAEGAPAGMLPQLGRRRAIAERDSSEDGCARRQTQTEADAATAEEVVVDEAAACKSAARPPPSIKVCQDSQTTQLAISGGRPPILWLPDLIDGC
jgi:hypothetical protein